MTLEEILQCDAAKLEAMSDADLLEHFKQYLPVTRPELAEKPVSHKGHQQRTEQKQQQMNIPISPQKQAALALLAAEGVDMSFLNRSRKK